MEEAFRNTPYMKWKYPVLIAFFMRISKPFVDVNNLGAFMFPLIWPRKWVRFSLTTTVTVKMKYDLHNSECDLPQWGHFTNMD